MTYIKQFEEELVQKLESTEDTTDIVRWVSEKVLESYRNGITAGQKGVQVIRKGEMAGARLNFIENRVLPLCRRLEAEDDVTVKSIDPTADGWFDV